MIAYPYLLLGAPETNEEQLNSGGDDPFDNCLIFFAGKRPERRALGVGNLKVRMARADNTCESIEHMRAAASRATVRSGP